MPAKVTDYQSVAHGSRTVQDFISALGIDPQSVGVHNTVEQIVDRALSFHPQIRHNLMAVRIEFNFNLKRVAGRAFQSGRIELHPGLLHGSKQDLIETFLHELAHIMQYYSYGVMDHGASWWEMMHQLGQRPKRTHNIGECQGKLQPKTAGLSTEDLGL